MAYLTQNEFINMEVPSDGDKSQCQSLLKSYISCRDGRAWSMNDKNRSKYLLDVLANAKSGDDCYTKGDDKNVKKSKDGKNIKNDQSKINDSSKANNDINVKKINLQDSLIIQAKDKLRNIEAVLEENNNLREKLKLSEERFKIVNKENDKIKAVVSRTGNYETFLIDKKLKDLQKTGELTPKVEIEILRKHIAAINLHSRKCDVLKAENDSLRLQIEKLEGRTKIEDISVVKETSNDIDYLQSKVEDLKKEVLILRAIEDKKVQVDAELKNLKKNLDFVDGLDDVENLKRRSEILDNVIEERNRLRSQINRMIGIEDKIALLRERALRADKLEEERDLLLKKLEGIPNEPQPQEIFENTGIVSRSVDKVSGKPNRDPIKEKMLEMEEQLYDLEKFKTERIMYKRKADKIQADYEYLLSKQQNNDKLIEELSFHKIKNNELVHQLNLKNDDLLEKQQQVYELEETIKYSEIYMEQLMDVINQLHAQKSCDCKLSGKSHNNNNLPEDGHFQDLISASKSTLEQIRNEFEARLEVESELERCKNELNNLKAEMLSTSSSQSIDVTRNQPINDFQENKILKQELERMQRELNKSFVEKQELETQTIELTETLENDAIETERMLEICRKEVDALHEEIEYLKNRTNDDAFKDLNDELQKCRVENDSLKIELERIRNNILEEADDDLEKLRNILTECREENANLNEQHNTDQEQNQDLIEKISALQDVHGNLLQNYQKVLEELEAFKNDVAEPFDVEKSTESSKMKESSNEKLELCQKELQEQKNNYEKEKLLLESKLREQINEFQNSEVDSANVQVLKDQLSKEQRKYLEDTSILQSQIEEYKKLYDSLKDNEASPLNEIENLLEKLNKERDETKKYNALNNELEEKFNALQNDFHDQTKWLESATEKVNILKYEIDQCKNDLENTKKNLQKVEDENLKLNAENEVISKELKDKINNLAVLENTIKDIKEKLERCEQELENYLKKNSDLTAEIEMLQKERENISKDLNKLENVAQESKPSEVNENDSKLNDLSSKLKSCEFEAQQLKEEMNQTIEKLLNEKQSLEIEVKKLFEERPRVDENEGDKELTEKIQNLLQEKEKLENTNKKLLVISNEFESFKKVTGELDEKLRVLQNENEDLKGKEKTENPERENTENLNQGKTQKLQDRISHLHKENEQLQNDNDKLKYENKKFQDENKKLSSDNVDCNRIKNELVEKTKDLLSDHNNLKKEKETELDILNRKIQSLIKDQETLQSENKRLESLTNLSSDQVKIELNNKINSLLFEKNELEKENLELRTDLSQLDKLVEEIELERKKNKDLEDLAKELEGKVVSESGKEKDNPDNFLQTTIDKLKKQLEIEIRKNDFLQGQLEKIQKDTKKLQTEFDQRGKRIADLMADNGNLNDQINELKRQLRVRSNEIMSFNAHKDDSTKDEVIKVYAPKEKLDDKEKPDTKKSLASSQLKPSTHLKKEPGLQIDVPKMSNMNLEDIQENFHHKIESIKVSHEASVQNLQSLHDTQLTDLIRNHDREIQFLCSANKSLRQSLMNIRKTLLTTTNEQISKSGLNEIKDEIEKLKLYSCKCVENTKLSGKASKSKLNELCSKIKEKGIQSLDIKDLTYLHSEIYKAGLKLNPLIASEVDTSRKCCKCYNFVCSLPSIPKHLERQFVLKMDMLEKEVDRANQALNNLKKYIELDSSGDQLYPLENIERFNSRRINDSLNHMLKNAAHYEKPKIRRKMATKCCLSPFKLQ